MGTKFLKHFSTRRTPQSEPIPGSAMVPNSAGGYAFAVDDWARLERFLILGSEGGSYYATERALTVENAQAVVRCLEADAARAIRTIVQVSDSGPGAEERAGGPGAGDRRGDGPHGGRRRGAAEGLPDGHAPVRLRRGRAGPARLGPRAAQGRRRLVRGQGRPRPWPTRSPSTSGGTAGRTATCSAWRTRRRPTPPGRRSTAGSSAGPGRSGRARSSGARRSRRTPTSPRTCRACSPRWTRPGRPTARRSSGSSARTACRASASRRST